MSLQHLEWEMAGAISDARTTVSERWIGVKYVGAIRQKDVARDAMRPRDVPSFGVGEGVTKRVGPHQNYIDRARPMHRLTPRGRPRISVPPPEGPDHETIRLFLKATSTNPDFDPRFAIILGLLAKDKVVLTGKVKEMLMPVNPRVTNVHLEQLRRMGWIDFDIPRRPTPGRYPGKIWRLAVPFAELVRFIAADSDRKEQEAKEAREQLLRMAEELTLQQFTPPELSQDGQNQRERRGFAASNSPEA